MSNEKKIVLNDEINEKDIEKENLSSEQIDAVAGGSSCDRIPARAVDLENRIPVRAVDLENRIPARSVDKENQ